MVRRPEADDHAAGEGAADGGRAGGMTRRKDVAPKRTGPLAKEEYDLVAQFVTDQPNATPQQTNDLAAAIRRTPAAVKKMIEVARDNFASKAERYVDIHAAATEAALASGTATGLDTAMRGAQWAIERMTADGVRVIDKPAGGGAGGAKILIGIQVGGIGTPVTAIAVPTEDE